jgi:hypothetical protein
LAMKSVRLTLAFSTRSRRPSSATLLVSSNALLASSVL